MSLGFRFTPFTSDSVTARWSASKDQPYSQNHSHSRSVSTPIPSSDMYTHAHQSGSHGRAPAIDPEEDALQRQIDSETDANTEFNAAKLRANIRPRSQSLDKGGRSSRSRTKDKEKDKAKKRALADQARRERRRTAGLDSDTTQGSSDDEYVTGYGKTRPVQGMFGSAGSKRGAFDAIYTCDI